VPDYVREDEANAAGMLKDAKDTEAADVLPGQKVEAYENVVKWFPNTKAAKDARAALERLLNAPPPPQKPKVPDVDLPKFEPPSRDADAITLEASHATVHPGSNGKIRYEQAADRDNIGFWYNEDDWVDWEMAVEKPGTFTVEVAYAAINQCDGNEYTVAVGDQALTGKVRRTGGWGSFKTETIGQVRIARAGKLAVSVKPKGKPREALMNLKAVTLKRVKD
jgi:hypothetical protein